MNIQIKVFVDYLSHNSAWHGALDEPAVGCLPEPERQSNSE
jgi:hypothetical protein